MSVGVGLFFAVGLLAAAAPLASEGANVLGVFTSSSPSHVIIHMAYVRILVERGHNVTVVTTTPLKEKNLRFNHIYVAPSEEAQRGMDEVKSNVAKKEGLLGVVNTVRGLFANIGRASREAIKDPRVQDLIHNPDNKFELMILGYFANDYELGIAAHMKCPIIISWMGPTNMIVDRYIGNPPEISYVPASPLLPSADPLTFTGRLWNFFVFSMTKLVIFLIDMHVKSNYKELFPAPEYPPIAELGKRVSLVFANSHFSEGNVRPNVPALVDVGGIQIKDKPDPLPENLRGVVDAASKHGVIYVSFGSNLGSKHIEGLTEKMYAVLSKLKQTVLWKWDGKDKPGNAANIHFMKWLPQDDLLAHPNMRLFITHAGKGSVAESLYHGVPMVAIPMFAEQPANAQKLAEDGFGVKMDHLSMTADSLRAAVMDVLENPKYRETVKRFSVLYKDRPLTARDTAAYWMEYVIRHKGAYHMQSPLVHLNGLQYLSLDVIAFLLLSLYVAFKILAFAVKSVGKLICGRFCSKKQKVKKH